MANTGTTRGRNQDRAKVAGGQDHEVKFEAGKTGASKDRGQVDGQVGRQQPQEGRG